MRILLPDDGYYAFYGRSIDFACRVFANGRLVLEMGDPGDTRETSTPNTGNVFFTLKADDGVIEIVQQASNFVHRESGGHTWLHIGKRGLGTFLAIDFTESIKLGSYLSLFAVHIFLFMLLKAYKGNLYFALFCLMWFLRTGVTGSRIFTHLFPWLPWVVKFRIEYLSFPVTAVLLLSLLDVLFPHILSKSFLRVMYGVSALIAVVFVFTNTVFMSYALLWCEAVYIPAIVYIIIRFAMKMRRLNPEHSVFLAGVGVFLIMAINDMLDSNTFFGIIKPPFRFSDMTSASMLLLAFCQAFAVFIVTVREMKTVAAENATLKEKARMTEQQLVMQRGHYSEIMRLVKREISVPYERVFCENSGVNAVAVYFLGLAEDEGVEIEVKLDIPEDTGSVPAMDLCVVMGNLLENALEACRRMGQGNKFIRVSSRIDGDSLGIEVIYCFDPGTTGWDLRLSSVKAVCEKHRGYVEHEITGEACTVAAMVKMAGLETANEANGLGAVGLEAAGIEAIFSQYGLSRREMEVALLLLTEGLGAEELGGRLFVSVHTAKYHIANIYRKFGVNRRSELMALFVKR